MNNELWHKAVKGKAHQVVWRFVDRVRQEQGDVFARHEKLEGLYDPYSPEGDGDPEKRIANVSENVVAGNIDTVHAAIATNEVRARVQTDNADFTTQRRARHLDLYAEGVTKLIGLHPKCRLAFKGAAKKGGGAVKVWADRWGDVRAMHVPINDIVVADADSRADAPPRQLAHVMRNVDKDELAAEYPEHETEIRRAHRGRSRIGLRAGDENQIVAVEIIRLPIGKRPPRVKGRALKTEKRLRGGPKYVPGRRIVCTEDITLVDEAYHKAYYPLAVISWLSREGSFYGISLGERIAGIQRALNKRNWTIERTLDQSANVTTFVRPADAGLQVRPNKIGNVVIVKGDWPQQPVLPAVHPETYKSREDLKDAAFQESGVSRLAAQSQKPTGLDSGRALMEYRAQTTQRFAPQEQDFEQLVLDAIFLALDACKELGAAAPTIIRQSKWMPAIKWSEVDMGELKFQLAAASTLPRTPAGKMQIVIEWAQAGVISQDDARSLMEHPDLEKAMSLYTAALETIEMQLEMILDGEIVVAEPYVNLAMAMWRGTAHYNLALQGKAPEDILEGLRQYIVQAGAVRDMQNAANANMAAGPAAPGAAAANANGMPAAPEIPPAPPGAIPQAAFAPQAMDLMAG